MKAVISADLSNQLCDASVLSVPHQLAPRTQITPPRRRSRCNLPTSTRSPPPSGTAGGIDQQELRADKPERIQLAMQSTASLHRACRTARVQKALETDSCSTQPINRTIHTGTCCRTREIANRILHTKLQKELTSVLRV